MMKHIIKKTLLVISGIAILTCFSINQVSAASVTELIAKMPAQSVSEFNEINANFVELGPEKIEGMCKILLPPGAGDDTKVRYAISGLAKYVSRPEAEADRKMVVEAMINALQSATNDEVQAFLIRQIQVAGKDEAVEPLGAYLTDERLCEPAAQALLAIGSQDASDALFKALPSVKGENLVRIIRALGVIQNSDASHAIKKYANSKDEKLRLVTLYALANSGDPAVKEVLAEATQIGSYYLRSEANSYYLLYARRLAEEGKENMAETICRELMESRVSPEVVNVRSGALSVLVQIKGKDALPDLLDAMKVESKQYRDAALDLAKEVPGKSATKKWTQQLDDVSSQVKQEILYMLGKRGDLAALPALLETIKSDDKDVQQSAIKASVKLGESKAIPALIDLLKDTKDSAIVRTAKEALLRLQTKAIAPAIVEALPEVTPSAQVALFDVLAERRARNTSQTVFEFTGNENQTVRQEAIKALAVLANENEIPKLIALVVDAKSGSERSAARKALVSTANRIDDPAKRAGQILEAISQKEGQEKAYLLQTLPEIGGKQALETVVSETQSQNEDMKDAAIKSLSEWPDIAAANPLLDIAAGTDNSKCRKMTLHGYTRLVNDSNLSAKKKVQRYEKSLDTIGNTEGQELLLDGLAQIRDVAALEPALDCLEKSELSEKAAATIIEIVCPKEDEDKGLRAPESYYALQKVVKSVEDADIKKKAEDFLEELPEPEPVGEPIGEGFVSLFNNYDLTGWIGDTKGYVVEDGTIVCKPGGNLYTENEYSDFVFSFEFKLTPGSNNGLGIRTPAKGNAAYQAMELQIIDNTADKYKNIKPWQKHGSIYGVVPAKVGYLKPVGEWNHEVVYANGPNIKVVLNGETIVDANIEEASTPKTIDGRNHPGLKRDKGHIGFLGHGSRVEFRNIKINTLE